MPIIAVEADDQQALEIAIIENVQRTDLNALEEASGYERLGSEFGYSQNDLAKVIGKSRSHVANTLRLLKLPESTKALLALGQISAGHARALLSFSKPDALAARIVVEGLTVRDVERIVQEEVQGGAQAKPEQRVRNGPADKDADTLALEKSLMTATGLVVKIVNKGESGEVTIRYKTLEQLESLCQRLQSEG